MTQAPIASHAPFLGKQAVESSGAQAVASKKERWRGATYGEMQLREVGGKGRVMDLGGEGGGRSGGGWDWRNDTDGGLKSCSLQFLEEA